MEVIQKISRMRAVAAQLRAAGKRVGCVPTMGYLHEGHLSLVRRCRELADEIVVTIFVNPAQFGPGEDYAAYPRDMLRDADMLAKEGVQLIFNPTPAEIYPEGYATYVEVEGLSRVLEGAHRPGHFRGVCTVVLKLFEIVQPHVAVFGQKDAQQLAVLARMARDLNLPVEIVRAPTMREADGLAMSSRNSYLGPEERKAAAVVYRALRTLQDYAEKGEETSAAKLKKAAMEVLRGEPLVAHVDYLALVDPRTFREVRKVKDDPVLALTAARIGKTRLIDNVLIHEARRSRES